MSDFLFDETDERPPLAGFRLAKLEIYNWGTFDGKVYSVQPNGQTTLLVGENGSGKSTLVDALLTLLVRPQSRNYNVAAGAARNERDERTYIRGAYDRTVGDAGRPQILYLRPGQGQYTVLLACFANVQTGAAFTLCQVLYLNNQNGVERVYALADAERGIVQDLGELRSGAGVAGVLRDAGFKTTASYKQYFGWLQRLTKMRPKAMDVFNQTVAVKDVQRLDDFIRRHMLERQPWNERVAQLLSHFAELSEAHRMLVRVRQQDELLRPVVEAGERYRRRVAEIAEARRRVDAAPLFFAQETVHLLQPYCDRLQQRIGYLVGEIRRQETLLEKLSGEIARLEIDIETAGGERLRQLPGLIEQADQIAAVKSAARARFEGQLKAAGISAAITSSEQLHRTREKIHQQRRKLSEQRQQCRRRNSDLQFEIGALVRQVAEDRREAEALEKRKGNLPEAFISLREQICRDLRLAPSDLPYAAELMAVDPQERQWEASIEQVLHGLARSLLVSGERYSRVAGYVDETRLVDARGRGQRLVYLRVGPRQEASGAQPGPDSLVHKLNFRDDHPLTPWLRAEISQRFDYTACDTVDQFQRVQGPAMTRNRHLKTGRLRHEKDDRSADADRRGFVLGWDNRQKRLALAEAIREGEADRQRLQQRSTALDAEIDRATAALESLEQALLVEDYDTIDNLRHEYEASQLRLERKRLEESDDQIVRLKSRLAERRAEAAGYRAERDGYIAERTTKENELKAGERWLQAAEQRLQSAEREGRPAEAREQFESLRKELKEPLTPENVAAVPEAVERGLREQLDRLQQRLVPVAKELTGGMTRFLKKFPDEQADLDADVDSLSSFEALYERISRDDLPKHEERFKRRLNEKVLHEIGLLHGKLETDRQAIRDKIRQLNTALVRLEWKTGTYMQLEPSDVPDREIQDFRRELAGCLSGTLDGTPEANEATFLRIEKLVAKLRDESNSRWREKVIDVRNWFNFAARELVHETGEARSYYDGGTGQSGGEKGKLAFLVLVAAIAYQYDLEPDSSQSDRFHFVMVDEMFSRSDDKHAEYALDLFERFGLQLLIVAPLDAKARVTEPYVGTYLHVVKDKQTHRSRLLAITAEELGESVEAA